MIKETSKSRMILPENRPLLLPGIHALHPLASCSGILSRHVRLPSGGSPQNLPTHRQHLCISPLIVLARNKACLKAVFCRNPQLGEVVCSIHAALKSPVGNLRRAIPGCVYRCRSSCAICGRPQRWGGIGVPDPVIVANFEDSIAHCSGVYISTVLTHHNANSIFDKLGHVGSAAPAHKDISVGQ